MTNKIKAVIITVVTALLIAGVSLFTYFNFLSSPNAEKIMKKIVSNDNHAVISVGVWENGKEELFIYNANGRQEYSPQTYQIGSITKTFVGAMVAFEESKGNLSLNDGNPPFKLLITHKSGLNDEWERSLAKNPSATFTREKLESMAKSADIKESDFCYSNFGSALAATRVAEIYAKDKSLADSCCQAAMNDFIKNELGLQNTEVGGKGDFENNYDWQDRDEMLAAGAVTSNVNDLLQYGKLYLDSTDRYSYLKSAITSKANMNSDYDIGNFWIIDKNSSFVWHNGELAMDGEGKKEVGYQSFIGISPDKNKVVVILSNSICNKGDTAYTDLLGYKLMTE